MGALMGIPVLRFAASPFPTHRAKIQSMTERDSSFEAICAVQRSAKRCRLNNVIRDPLLACLLDSLVQLELQLVSITRAE